MIQSKYWFERDMIKMNIELYDNNTVSAIRLKYVVEVVFDSFVYNGKKRQEAYITINLKNEINKISMPILFFTKFINKKFKGSSAKTRENNAYYLVNFLNFVLIENKDIYKLKSIYDLKILHAEEFLNYYGYKVSYSSVTRAEKVLDKFYKYICEEEVARCLDYKILDSQISVFLNVRYPKRKPTTRNHYFPKELILSFIEVARYEFSNIALGVYMQFFGGLRIGDITNVKYSDIRIIKDTLGYSMLVNIKYRANKYKGRTSIREGTKKERVDQIVFGYENLLMDLYNENRLLNNISENMNGYILLNKRKTRMSKKTYTEEFNKLKERFIEILLSSDSVKIKNMALLLERRPWASHIGRGTFTNIIRDNISNPAIVAQVRGDDSIESSIDYNECTPEVYKKVSTILNDILGTNTMEVYSYKKNK